MALIALLLASAFAAVIALRRWSATPHHRATPPPTRPSAVRATKFAQKDVVVHGHRVRYIDEGSGPPLLLVPGHTSRIEEYDVIVKKLRSRFRVMALDFPGSGYSDKPVRRYDLPFYDAVLIGFLDAMGVGTCALAGGSLGGNLVLRAAHAHPKRFTRIVAWGPASSWPARPLVAKVLHLLGYIPFVIVSRIQSRYWYAKTWRGRRAALEATFAYYDEVMCPGFVRMYWGIAADQIGTTLRDIAKDIRQPVLLMWGDRDHGLNMGEGVRCLRSRIPQSELLIFRNAGHALATERPRMVAERILEFLSRPDRT